MDAETEHIKSDTIKANLLEVAAISTMSVLVDGSANVALNGRTLRPTREQLKLVLPEEAEKASVLR